jgi:TfoX/Sxy family transcriptional regulator of competence genes
MSSTPSCVDFILEQIAEAGAVSAKKMFGEYGIYCDGKMVALVCDDQFFVKPTDAGRAFAGDIAEAPPYPSAKPCLLIAGDRWDDRAWMSELIRLTTQALPLPKPKQLKAPKPG